MKERTMSPAQTIKLVDNFTELGSMLHVKNNLMAYARKFRGDLQVRIRLGKRTVYASKSPLSGIQRRLNVVFSELMKELPEEEVAIAYRPGLNVVNELAKWQGSAIMIKTDIRHYYDNVSYAHIERALMDCGMIARGARLVASYCTVWNGRFSSLQQGSACSPALANIVGNRYFDRPIVSWLREHCPVKHQYYRYSDNIVLFCREEPGDEFVKQYKEFVKETARKGQFRTHAWSSIRNNHPTRHQEFLGIILNEVAGISRVKRDRMRAILWNALTKDRVQQARAYFEKAGGLPSHMTDEMIVEHFMASMQGYVSYANMVQEKFAKRIWKLYAVLKMQEEAGQRAALDGQAVRVLATYVNDNEGVLEFTGRMTQALS